MVNVMGAATADIDELWNPVRADEIPDRNKGSWSTLIEDWRVLLKTTTAHMRTMYDQVFDEMPNMRKAARGADAPFVQELKIYRLNPENDDPDVVIPESRFSQPMLDAIQRHDRWALARAAEDAAPVPVVARCRRLTPGFDLVAIPRRLLTNPDEFGMHFDETTPAARLEELVKMGVIA